MNVFAIQPFGAAISPGASAKSIHNVNTDELKGLIQKHALLLLRGFNFVEDDQFVEFSKKLGELLEWEFGPILELKINANPTNHIFTSGKVELHWDGAFIDKEPHFNIFNCIEGSPYDQGGQTLFVDTRRVLKNATATQLEHWRKITVTYTTEKKAHYGGRITEKLVTKNDFYGCDVIRFIEAFNEDNANINPMDIRVEGVDREGSDAFLRSFNAHLYSSAYLYAHTWQSGDIIVADNSVLLHGRHRFFRQDSARHIKRINIV